MRMQVIIVIRFSYVAEGGFRLSRDGLDAARATLYAPDRLERRFRLFEALTLPSLLGQTDPDFTLAVLVGTDFPASARSRLAQLIAPLRDAHIVALPPYNNYRSTKDALQACTRPEATHILSLRLDDDDALGRDVVEAQKRIAPTVAAAGPADAPAVVCFNNGLFLELSEQGNRLYGVIEKLPLGIGMGMLAQVDARPTIFSTDHRQVHTRWNTYTEALTPRFIRTVHRDNDSGALVSGKRIDYDAAQIDTVLRRHFCHDQASLLALAP
ncbi:glycosyltransferase [Natronohydrobacter thiooxidans]|uniref:glycosyltransferase n=1 Tax=Natronohydrobacter thiooxidans TaxID=87172 RepID=UPI0008FF6AA9|nr:glycosyltransferase [Natronohydrobacter thiooxidans]